MRHPVPSAAASAELGRRLWQHRVRRGLRQYELAEEIGVCSPQVSAWESADKNPSLGSILLLCRALGVTPGALLDGLEHL